jgi:hypothetical protein
MANCYWPGGGKEGQFPPGFGQQTKVNATTSTPAATSSNPMTAAISTTKQVESFVLSVCVPDTPGLSRVLINTLTNFPPMALISKGFQNFGKEIPTFLDSGANDTMFVLKEMFTGYTLTASRVGDSAKAVDSGFEIVGEGNVIQRYKVNDKECLVTYTCALHTPALNANLLSVSTFDRAGLITTFSNGQGVV